MIACVGPALIDYIHEVDEYPPLGGHAVVKSTSIMPGGAGGNVVYGLSKLGLKCRFYTTLGEDVEAELYLEDMKRVGVEVRYSISHRETGKCHIYVDKRGERTFFVHPNAAGRINLEIENEELEELDYLYLDPFPSKQSFDFHLDVAKRAKEAGCEIIINPGFPYISLGLQRLMELLNYCDLVFASKDEIGDLPIQEIQSRVKLLVITLGKEGSTAYSGGRRYFARAFEVKAVDTTGAGDAFAAGFIYAYLGGFDVESCLKAGNFAASKNVQKLGARNFPEREEMTGFLDKLVSDLRRAEDEG
jgi:ribokinase